MAFPDKHQAVQQASRDAKEVLERHWVGRGLPVDPVQVAESLGVEVYRRWIPGADVYGALRKRKGEPAQIFIESSDPPTRKRFTCAHELGHFWRARSRGEEDIERIDLRSDLSSRGVDFEEVYANAFAANLLMPEELVRREWGALGEFHPAERQHRLAAAFYVSQDAMGYRLRNIGLLEAAT